MVRNKKHDSGMKGLEIFFHQKLMLEVLLIKQSSLENMKVMLYLFKCILMI